MPKDKTATQIFIETAGGFFRAIGELDNVARQFGGDSLERKAYEGAQALQRTLAAEIVDWNDMDDADHPRIIQCSSTKRYVPWDARANCDVFTASAEGICPACAALKAAIETEERGAA